MYIIFLLTDDQGHMYSLTNMRQKAPLKWNMGDGFEIVMYPYCNAIRTDITRKTDKKTAAVSLKPNQFTTLFHISRMLSNSVNEFKCVSYNLGELIYASHEVFRRVWTINLRQFYTDESGDEKPTRTGVNIPHHTWIHEIVPILPEIRKYLIY